MRQLALPLASLALLAGCAGPAAAPPPAAGQEPLGDAFDAQGASLGQVVVMLKSRGRLPDALGRGAGADAPRILDRIDALGALVLEAPAGQASRGPWRDALSRDPAVASLSPARRARFAGGLADPPNDPKLPEQWALARVEAPAAWRIQAGSPALRVGVIDSGADLKHPELAGKIASETFNALDLSAPPLDDHGHGTHCAGVVAAMTGNGQGVAGAAPGVGLLIARVLNKSETQGSDATIARGIVWATDHGAKVLSISLEIPGRSPVLESALDYALAHDVLVVAAAGNEKHLLDHQAAPALPASYPGVLAVAATDAEDKPASFTNFGPAVSLAAPGVDILSTLPTYKVFAPLPRPLGYGTMSGTSMAAPLVAGAAALVRSQFPALTRAQVKARLEASADDLGAPGFDPVYGHGRLNIRKAVSE